MKTASRPFWFLTILHGIYSLTATAGSCGCPGNLRWSHVGVFQWFCVAELNSKWPPMPAAARWPCIFHVGPWNKYPTGSHDQVNICIPANQLLRKKSSDLFMHFALSPLFLFCSFICGNFREMLEAPSFGGPLPLFLGTLAAPLCKNSR